jgi:hypothetical protein
MGLDHPRAPWKRVLMKHLPVTATAHTYSDLEALCLTRATSLLSRSGRALFLSSVGCNLIPVGGTHE